MKLLLSYSQEYGAEKNSTCSERSLIKLSHENLLFKVFSDSAEKLSAGFVETAFYVSVLDYSNLLFL